MKPNSTVIVLHFLLVAGVWMLVLQAERLIRLLGEHPLPVAVSGKIDTSGSTVLVGGRVDANLSAVVGFPLVTSQSGMHIGVGSQEGRVIPIDWGEVSLEEGMKPVNVNISEIAGDRFGSPVGQPAALPVRVADAAVAQIGQPPTPTKPKAVALWGRNNSLDRTGAIMDPDFYVLFDSGKIEKGKLSGPLDRLLMPRSE